VEERATVEVEVARQRTRSDDEAGVAREPPLRTRLRPVGGALFCLPDARGGVAARRLDALGGRVLAGIGEVRA